jgi:hypothetical protein
MGAKLADDPKKLAATLRRWQELEAESINQTRAIADKTNNPLIRLIMEIIRHDSSMHAHVQQVIIDSLEKEAFSLSPDELADIWDLIEQHTSMEKETITLADQARRNVRGVIQRYLLNYLIEDEQKHDRLLAQLEDFKRNLYPYASS